MSKEIVYTCTLEDNRKMRLLGVIDKLAGSLDMYSDLIPAMTRDEEREYANGKFLPSVERLEEMENAVAAKK